MASLLIAHPGDRWFLLNSFEPAHPHFQWREWQRRKKTMVNARIDQRSLITFGTSAENEVAFNVQQWYVYLYTPALRSAWPNNDGTPKRNFDQITHSKATRLIEQRCSEVRRNTTRRGITVPLLLMNTIEHYTILNCTINEKQASSSRNRPKLDPTSIVSSAEAISLVFETFQYIIRTEVKNDYEFASLNTPSLLKLHSSPLVVETVRFLHSKLIQPETISL